MPHLCPYHQPVLNFAKFCENIEKKINSAETRKFCGSADQLKIPCSTENCGPYSLLAFDWSNRFKYTRIISTEYNKFLHRQSVVPLKLFSGGHSSTACLFHALLSYKVSPENEEFHRP